MVRASTRYVVFALVMLSLVACTTHRAKVVSHGVANANLKNPYTITVKSSETLDSLASRYHVSTQKLIDLNHLKAPYTISKGMVLRLPSAQYHIVQRGDTLFGIARGYGVDMNQLIAINHIQDPQHILSGSTLYLSPESKNNPEVSTTTANLAPQNTVVPSSNTDITVNELAPLSTTSNAAASAPSAPITSPISEVSSAATSDTLSPITNDPASASNGSTLLPTATPVGVEAASIASTTPAPEIIPTPPPTATASITKAPISPAEKTPSTENTTSGNFMWPVQGKIISRFGPRKGGLYNDGINIAAPEGSAIKAASDGIVVYSGNELRGYGNLLLIKHDNGFVTAYAHTAKNTVTKDEAVRKGDIIGYVGKTGHVSSPQLHFSIRKDRKALNPERHLPVLLSKN